MCGTDCTGSASEVGPLRWGESPRPHVAAGVSLRKTANDVTLAANAVTACAANPSAIVDSYHGAFDSNSQTSRFVVSIA